MDQKSDEITLIKKELENKCIELENNNKLLSKISRERDVSMKYNNELRQQLELLNAKLHLHQNIVKTTTVSVHTQTELTFDINEKTHSLSNSENHSDQVIQSIDSNSWKKCSESKNTRISDLVRETAQNNILKNDFENDYYYDKKSNTYYSRSSGWYYYPDRYLFYDPNSKNYYKYDSEKKVYNYYSSLKESENKRQNCNESHEPKKSKRMIDLTEKDESIDLTVENSDKSDTETICCSASEEGEIYSSDEDIESPIGTTSEEKTDWGPPLVRLIVKKSSTLEIGSLLIVTGMGAKIGNDSKCDVWITDKSVSRLHAQIRFDDSKKMYTIKDQNSTNGTFSNGVKIENDSEIPLKHYDEISFGRCLLLVHIHEGRDVTCDNCEPGIVISKIAVNSDNQQICSETDRRKNLKTLKKKYGLKNVDYCEVKSFTAANYVDRSGQRRKEKGSDNPYEKTAAGTSLDIPLSQANKGFKMMEKLGWNPGQALGKNIDGIIEPIRPTEKSQLQ